MLAKQKCSCFTGLLKYRRFIRQLATKKFVLTNSNEQPCSEILAQDNMKWVASKPSAQQCAIAGITFLLQWHTTVPKFGYVNKYNYLMEYKKIHEQSIEISLFHIY